MDDAIWARPFFEAPSANSVRHASCRHAVGGRRGTRELEQRAPRRLRTRVRSTRPRGAPWAARHAPKSPRWPSSEEGGERPPAGRSAGWLQRRAGGRAGGRSALPAGPEEPPQPASHPAGARFSHPRVRRARLSAAAFGARVARDYGRKAAGVVGGVLCLVRPDGGAPGCRAGRSARMGACSVSGGSGPAAGCSARSVQQAAGLSSHPLPRPAGAGTWHGTRWKACLHRTLQTQ